MRPKDGAFLSTISTSEVIECSLNERQNFSPAIGEKLRQQRCALSDITAVQDFLIRDMGVEMTPHPTPASKKCVRLEPDMWKVYLKDCRGFRHPEQKRLSVPLVVGTVEIEADESVTALATFRAYYTGNLLFYAAPIVLIGAGKRRPSLWNCTLTNHKMVGH